MSSSPLKVLRLPISGVGHINPMLAVATAVKQKGHHVTFATERSLIGKFSPHGFREAVYDEKDYSKDDGSNHHWVDMVQRMKACFREDPLDKLETMRNSLKNTFSPFSVDYADPRIGEVIKATSPDVIIYESFTWHTSVLFSDIPVVQLITTHPMLALDGEKLPPGSFGLSLYSDPSTWPIYRQKAEEHTTDQLAERHAKLRALGAPAPRLCTWDYISSNLNILIYPRSLTKPYLERSTTSEYFVTIDHALRPTDNVFTLPDKMKELPGKLVFLSMGSLGSNDVELMKLLVSHLAKAGPKYKFIVAKGALHDQYELADNMWGERYVPQLGVLPLVDLALIHGGNNSFTETLYFGKPMIVIPLFFDQLDNAQVAVDEKLGARFNPFKQTGDELIQLMGEVLDNQEISENVKRISKEMQESRSIEEAVERIEYVAKNPKRPIVLQK